MGDPNALPHYPAPSKLEVVHAQYAQQPYVQPPNAVHVLYQGQTHPSITQIHDWLPWSIINMFIDWIIDGIFPLIFSIVCISYKNSNNASRARTMSTLALVFNILVTLAGIGGWIALIVVLVVVKTTVSTALDTNLNTGTLCHTWPIC
jgi:hypothetical protein